jgi:hypothetical protein
LADAFSGGGAAYCTIQADPVRVSGRRIVAPGRFRCDRPGPASLSMTVVLQKLSPSGTWVPIASQQFTAKAAATTRDLSEGQRTRTVSTPCAAGTYRTSVTATSTGRAAKQYASPSRANPCG